MAAKRTILVTFGWFVSAVVLYAAFTVLEFHWNLVSWRAAADQVAWGLFLLIFVTLLGTGLLGRMEVGRSMGLVVCLALFALGAYLLPAEPLQDGLFGRRLSSPAWYRFGRFIVLALPLVFWLLGPKWSKMVKNGQLRRGLTEKS